MRQNKIKQGYENRKKRNTNNTIVMNIKRCCRKKVGIINFYHDHNPINALMAAK